MRQILQPKVIISQQLTVSSYTDTVSRMKNMSELENFSHRLNELCDEKDIPLWGRQVAMGKIFDVSQNGARKWLDGESWPRMETLIKISAWADVSIDWLISGRGEKRKSQHYSSEPISHVLTVMENMSSEQQFLLARLADQVIQPPKNDETIDNAPKNRKAEQ